MDYKTLLKIVPTIQAASLANANAKFAMKKKKSSKDLVNVGVGNIVGAALIKEQADFLNS
jgi:hypothetical protein